MTTTNVRASRLPYLIEKYFRKGGFSEAWPCKLIGKATPCQRRSYTPVVGAAEGDEHTSQDFMKAP